MRILAILPSLFGELGGIQTYCQALVYSLNQLAKPSGAKIDVYALNDVVNQTPEQLRQIEHVNYQGFGRSKGKLIWKCIGSGERYDVVAMTHVNFLPLIHILRMRNPSARFCVSAHGIEVWRRLEYSKASAMKYVDRILPVSDFTRREMIRQNPELKAKGFYYLPNTLGPFYRAQVVKHESRHQLALPLGKMILCVSRMSSLEPYKNVELLVRAMPQVLEGIPQAFLVLVGPGDDRERLEGIAIELGVKEKVVFTGRVADESLPSYFHSCDLFALPSTGEGFGIVFLEAMFHGKACVGARAGGAPEVIEDGVTGVLVPELTSASITQCVVSLLKNDELRGQMGATGRSRLENHFSLVSFQNKVKGLLLELNA